MTNYDLDKIKTFLIEGFTDQELRDLCFYENDFRPVYDNLAPNVGKAEIIRQLLEYAKQKEKIDLLITWGKDRNPARYEEHGPYTNEILDQTVTERITGEDASDHDSDPIHTISNNAGRGSINWEKIGAIAAVISVVIAVLALWPMFYPTQDPTPTPSLVQLESALASTNEPPPRSTDMATPTDSPSPKPTAFTIDTPTPSPVPTSTNVPTNTPTPLMQQVVAANVVNIRSGPSVDYPVIGTLPPDNPLTVTGRDADSTWWQVRQADDTIGWVAAWVVEVEGDLDGVPIFQALPSPPPPPPPSLMLQDFEFEGSFYEVWQVEATLSNEIVHSGNNALRMTGTGGEGEGQTVGVHLNDQPVDLTAYDQICLWVYDTVGNNSLELRLVDSENASQTVWSDQDNAANTPFTRQNAWVQICFNLAEFDQVDHSALNDVEIYMFHTGDYYIDEIMAQPTDDDDEIITPPSLMLQDFENEGSYYNVFQANGSLSSDIRHSGTSALRMTGTTGDPGHTVGAYLYDRPVDLTRYDQICLWVYDTVGSNTMELRLVNTDVISQAAWTEDYSDDVDNIRTQQNQWVRICFNLAIFNQVDLSAVNRVQMTMWHNGEYYFDDISAERQPTE